MYKEFKDWPLVVLAYNQGERKVRDYVRNAKRNSPNVKNFSYQEIKSIIPKNYFVANNFLEILVAVKEVAKNPIRYRLNFFKREPISFDEVKVKKTISLYSLAKKYNTTVGMLKLFNPDIKKYNLIIHNRAYTLKIPPQKL